MSEVFLAFGWNNLMVSAALALIAWAVQRDGRSPFLAHLLWLLVLAKLVTPPLWGVGMVEVPWQSSEQVALEQQAADLIGATLQPSVTGSEVVLSSMPLVAPTATPLAEATQPSALWGSAQQVLFGLWIAGSALVFLLSSYRILRFHRLLRWGTQAAAPSLQDQADAFAKRIGLRRPPQVFLSEARLAPLVWCLGGRPRLVLPAHLLDELEPSQLEWVLAHEMTHIQRRDHLVRWLEWLACVAFWWNPVAWWARKNLRTYEEICCDAQVLRSLRAEPRAYAASLLQVAASLAPPDVRPPAVASAFTDGGELERRFHMILSKNPLTRISRRLQAVVLMGAVALLPLGIATAQEPDYEAVHQRLSQAVAAGELSAPQAQAMLDALKQKASADKDAVGKRLQDAMDAGEITPEQAKAMMMVLERDGSNTQSPLRSVPRLESSEIPTGEYELLKLDFERLKLEEELQVMRLEQERFFQHAAELDAMYAEAQNRTQLLLESGHLSQADADLQLIELKEKLWNAEKEVQAAVEFMHLQERMQEMERNLLESRQKAAEVEALRETEQQMLKEYSAALQSQINLNKLSEQDAKEILDAAKDHALEQRLQLQLEEQRKQLKEMEAQKSDLENALQDLKEAPPIQEPKEPFKAGDEWRKVEDPWGSRR
ncbi:MAG: M56 family metallopeptidase [Planctomycetota bacterium]